MDENRQLPGIVARTGHYGRPACAERVAGDALIAPVAGGVSSHLPWATPVPEPGPSAICSPGRPYGRFITITETASGMVPIRALSVIGRPGSVASNCPGAHRIGGPGCAQYPWPRHPARH
jgi:hypothetical protein